MSPKIDIGRCTYRQPPHDEVAALAFVSVILPAGGDFAAYSDATDLALLQP
jgi:hypothetical protein